MASKTSKQVWVVVAKDYAGRLGCLPQTFTSFKAAERFRLKANNPQLSVIPLASAKELGAENLPEVVDLMA